MSKARGPFVPLQVAVLTVSATRTTENDTAGDLIAERLTTAGHQVTKRAIVPHDVNLVRNQLSVWVSDPEVQAIVSSGGTGLSQQDVTPEAVEPLITKPIPGFGELFRWLSYDEIGSATIESRAMAGVAWDTLVFLLPGSPGACRLAVEKIIVPQLDATTAPCNLVALLPRASNNSAAT